MKKLPDAEFQIMKQVWAAQPPVTAGDMIGRLSGEKGWKATTVNTLMMRLVERGYLRTEKNGKERTYYPLVAKEDYLQFETDNFVRQYHENSLVNLFQTFYDGKKLGNREIDELMELLEERRE